MGWKQSSIFIKVGETKTVEEISQALGLDAFEKCDPEPFEAVTNPSDACYVGYLGELLVISHPSWPNEIFLGDETIIEKLTSLFPKSKILVLGLQSVINHYSYILYESGKLIRKKYGDTDEPVREDIGELLHTEKAFIEKRIAKIERGKYDKEYYFKDDPGDGYPEDALGENFVSSVLKEVWDYELMDMPDEYFFESMLQGYVLPEDENKVGAYSPEVLKNTEEKWTYRPNWKRHLLTIAILFVAILIHRLFGC